MKTLSDIQSPATVARKLLEKDVQKQCVDWAKARGYWARKFSSMSQRSVPDYLFSREQKESFDCGHHGDRRLKYSKMKFACEFKRPRTKPKYIPKHDVTVMSTEAQFEEQADMRLAGWFVFECDNFDKFKATVIAYEKEQA